MKQLSQWFTMGILACIFAAVGLIIFVAQSDGTPQVVFEDPTPETSGVLLVPTVDAGEAQLFATAFPPTPVPAEEIVVVQAGDSLAIIASRYGITWEELATHNNITDPTRLDIGQEIRIPVITGE